MSDTQRSFDVIGIGGAAVDLVGVLERPLRLDAKQRLTSFTRHAGGTVCNTLVALARLGMRSAYMGRLGTDEYSDLLIAEFRCENVSTDLLTVDPAHGPYVAVVIADPESGQRTIFWTDERVRAITVDQLNRAAIRATRALYLDDWALHEPAAAVEAARIAHEFGAVVVLDAENPRNREYQETFPLADALIVGDEYARTVTGTENVAAAATALCQVGAATVVVTQGAQGCHVATADGSFRQTAFPVDAVDTTGCGDAFHAGFLYGMLRHWSADRCAEFGAAVAALKCRKPGARGGLPTFTETRDFLGRRGSGDMRSLLKRTFA